MKYRRHESVKICSDAQQILAFSIPVMFEYILDHLVLSIRLVSMWPDDIRFEPQFGMVRPKMVYKPETLRLFVNTHRGYGCVGIWHSGYTTNRRRMPGVCCRVYAKRVSFTVSNPHKNSISRPQNNYACCGCPQMPQESYVTPSR